MNVYILIIITLLITNVIAFFKGYRYFLALGKQEGLDYYLKKQDNLKKDLEQLSLIETSLQLRFDYITGDASEPILVSELGMLQVGEWYSPNDTIRYKLINVTDSDLTFITEMEDGATFSQHYHDCEEKCYIHEGCLVSPERGIKTNVNESVTYHPYEKHTPFAIGKTVLTVVFNKRKAI